MDEMKYAKLTEVNGRANAEMIESLLEAEGIDVELIQDSISYSSYATPFALVQIFVPKEMLEQARELIKGFDDVLQNDGEDDEE